MDDWLINDSGDRRNKLGEISARLGAIANVKTIDKDLLTVLLGREL